MLKLKKEKEKTLWLILVYSRDITVAGCSTMPIWTLKYYIDNNILLYSLLHYFHTHAEDEA